MTVLDIDQVAALLKMTVPSVRRLCRSAAQRKSDPLPVFKIHSKAVRFHESKIRAWLARRSDAGVVLPPSKGKQHK